MLKRVKREIGYDLTRIPVYCPECGKHIGKPVYQEVTELVCDVCNNDNPAVVKCNLCGRDFCRSCAYDNGLHSESDFVLDINCTLQDKNICISEDFDIFVCKYCTDGEKYSNINKKLSIIEEKILNIKYEIEDLKTYL